MRSRTVYKFLEKGMTSQYDGSKWKLGKARRAKPGKARLCSETVLHAYSSWQLGMFMNPLHSNITNPHVYAGTGTVYVDDRTKLGCKTVTLRRCVRTVRPSVEQCVEFAIRCALLVYNEVGWVAWASSWLSGVDRTVNAADAAYAAAATRADAAADAAYADAAYAAARAARAAAYATRASAAAYAADAAADAAAYAADAATINQIAIGILTPGKKGKSK